VTQSCAIKCSRRWQGPGRQDSRARPAHAAQCGDNAGGGDILEQLPARQRGRAGCCVHRCAAQQRGGQQRKGQWQRVIGGVWGQLTTRIHLCSASSVACGASSLPAYTCAARHRWHVGPAHYPHTPVQRVIGGVWGQLTTRIHLCSASSVACGASSLPAYTCAARHRWRVGPAHYSHTPVQRAEPPGVWGQVCWESSGER